MYLANNESKKINLGFSIAVLVISILYIIVVIGWISLSSGLSLTQLSKTASLFLISMEVMTLLAGPAVVCLIAIISTISLSNVNLMSFLSMAFATCFAVLTSANHFLYLTIFNKIIFKDSLLEDLFSLAKWPSIVMAIDYIAWGFFLGLALLFSAFTFKAIGNLYVSIRSILIVSGILCISGLSGPLTGNLGLWFISVTGYTIGITVVSILLIKIFSKVPVIKQ